MGAWLVQVWSHGDINMLHVYTLLHDRKPVHNNTIVSHNTLGYKQPTRKKRFFIVNMFIHYLLYTYYIYVYRRVYVMSYVAPPQILNIIVVLHICVQESIRNVLCSST